MDLRQNAAKMLQVVGQGRRVLGMAITACFCPFGTILSACAEQKKTGENDGSYIGVFHCLAPLNYAFPVADTHQGI